MVRKYKQNTHFPLYSQILKVDFGINSNLALQYIAKINVYIIPIQCVDDTKSSTRIGGPDSCVVRPHSEPWIARLVYRDGIQLAQTITKMSKEYQIHQKNQNKSAMSELLKDFDSKIDKWTEYFEVEKRDETKSKLKSIRENLGASQTLLNEMIYGLPLAQTIEFASKSVYTIDGHLCGGSLISKRHVLTAAHCVCSRDELNGIFPGNTTSCTFWKDLAVVLGDHDVEKKDGEKVFRINITSVYEAGTGTTTVQPTTLAGISRKYSV